MVGLANRGVDRNGLVDDVALAAAAPAQKAHEEHKHKHKRDHNSHCLDVHARVVVVVVVCRRNGIVSKSKNESNAKQHPT